MVWKRLSVGQILNIHLSYLKVTFFLQISNSKLRFWTFFSYSTKKILRKTQNKYILRAVMGPLLTGPKAFLNLCFWTILLHSTLEHSISLKQQNSQLQVIFCSFAKFICIQLWCNLTILASRTHTYTLAHTHTKSRTPLCSLCVGLMRSMVSLRHVHTMIHPRIHLHRLVYTPNMKLRKASASADCH